MNITKQIEGKHYVATERDVELLAHEHLTSTQSARRSDGAYLRILIVGLQAQFNGTANKRRALKPTELRAHSDFLAEQHGRLYVYVLKGVTTPEVMDDETLDVAVRRARAAERNGRAAFARSAASTLQSFIRAGGDVRGLVPEDVTKSWLRAWVAQTVEPELSLREQAVRATARRLANEMRKLATEDEDAARRTVAEAMRELQAVLDELGADNGAHVESGVFQRERGATFRQRAASA